ncbi:MAG: restriction endonuclease [Thermoanaerobaculia bacterium]|nr:restriction endonuclease [Thermoanaerobaculia bacterium]
MENQRRLDEEADSRRQAERIAEERRKLEEKQRKHDEFLRQKGKEDYILRLTPREFEEYCALVFRGMGYEASVTRYSGDGGVDIELRKEGKKGVAQCKHQKAPVGVNVVRELFGAQKASGAAFSAILTTARLTGGARKFCNIHRIQVFELPTLAATAERVISTSVLSPGMELPGQSRQRLQPDPTPGGPSKLPSWLLDTSWEREREKSITEDGSSQEAPKRQ